MNSDVLSRIADIRTRVDQIRAHFGHAGAPQGFAQALDQSAKPVSVPAPAPTPQASVGPYAGVISKEAARQGLDPALVQAVVQTESGGNPQAKSPVGALGLMQLMPETARDLGVKNPLDPVENIQGGTKYLAGLTQRYGLEEGIAAYNAGPGAVERHHGVPPYPETQHYVKKVLALYSQFKRPDNGGNTP